MYYFTVLSQNLPVETDVNYKETSIKIADSLAKNLMFLWCIFYMNIKLKVILNGGSPILS